MAAIAHGGGKALHPLFGLPIKEAARKVSLPPMASEAREAAHRWLHDAEVILFDKISMVSPLQVLSGHFVARLNEILPADEAYIWYKKAFTLYWRDTLQLPLLAPRPSPPMR
jgi:hypothetical protein